MQEKIQKTGEAQQNDPQQKPTMTHKHGNTTYDIYIHFSKISKETFSDKVVRLIKNDMSTNEISQTNIRTNKIS
jgi:hypothetical protein